MSRRTEIHSAHFPKKLIHWVNSLDIPGCQLVDGPEDLITENGHLLCNIVEHIETELSVVSTRGALNLLARNHGWENLPTSLARADAATRIRGGDMGTLSDLLQMLRNIHEDKENLKMAARSPLAAKAVSAGQKEQRRATKQRPLDGAKLTPTGKRDSEAQKQAWDDSTAIAHRNKDPDHLSLRPAHHSSLHNASQASFSLQTSTMHDPYFKPKYPASSSPIKSPPRSNEYISSQTPVEPRRPQSAAACSPTLNFQPHGMATRSSSFNNFTARRVYREAQDLSYAEDVVGPPLLEEKANILEWMERIGVRNPCLKGWRSRKEDTALVEVPLFNEMRLGVLVSEIAAAVEKCLDGGSSKHHLALGAGRFVLKGTAVKPRSHAQCVKNAELGLAIFRNLGHCRVRFLCKAPQLVSENADEDNGALVWGLLEDLRAAYAHLGVGRRLAVKKQQERLFQPETPGKHQRPRRPPPPTPQSVQTKQKNQSPSIYDELPDFTGSSNFYRRSPSPIKVKRVSFQPEIPLDTVNQDSPSSPAKSETGLLKSNETENARQDQAEPNCDAKTDKSQEEEGSRKKDGSPKLRKRRPQMSRRKRLEREKLCWQPPPVSLKGNPSDNETNLLKILDPISTQQVYTIRHWIYHMGLNSLQHIGCEDLIKCKLRNGVLLAEIMCLLDWQGCGETASLKDLIHWHPFTLAQVKENIGRVLWLLRLRHCPPVKEDYLSDVEGIIKGEHDLVWGLLWQLMVCFPCQPFWVSLKRSLGRRRRKENIFPQILPQYSRLDRAALEHSLVRWIDKDMNLWHGFAPAGKSSAASGKGFVDCFSLEPAMKDGTFFCALTSKVIKQSIKGTYSQPRTEALAAVNITHAVDALRLHKEMGRRHLVPGVEEKILSGDWSVMLGILEDLHRAYDGIPAVHSAKNSDPDPYLGDLGPDFMENEIDVQAEELLDWGKMMENYHSKLSCSSSIENRIVNSEDEGVRQGDPSLEYDKMKTHSPLNINRLKNSPGKQTQLNSSNLAPVKDDFNSLKQNQSLDFNYNKFNGARMASNVGNGSATVHKNLDNFQGTTARQSDPFQEQPTTLRERPYETPSSLYKKQVRRSAFTESAKQTSEDIIPGFWSAKADQPSPIKSGDSGIDQSSRLVMSLQDFLEATTPAKGNSTSKSRVNKSPQPIESGPDSEMSDPFEAMPERDVDYVPLLLGESFVSSPEDDHKSIKQAQRAKRNPSKLPTSDPKQVESPFERRVAQYGSPQESRSRANAAQSLPPEDAERMMKGSPKLPLPLIPDLFHSNNYFQMSKTSSRYQERGRDSELSKPCRQRRVSPSPVSSLPLPSMPSPQSKAKKSISRRDISERLKYGREKSKHALTEDFSRFMEDQQAINMENADSLYISGSTATTDGSSAPLLSQGRTNNRAVDEHQTQGFNKLISKGDGLNRQNRKIGFQSPQKPNSSKVTDAVKWLASQGIKLKEPHKLFSECTSEFSDGVLLGSLVAKLEFMKGTILPGLNNKPKSRAACIQNLRKTLNFLYERNKIPVQMLQFEGSLYEGSSKHIVQLLISLSKKYGKRLPFGSSTNRNR